MTNTFDESFQTYFGTDVDKISDPLRRTAIKTMIKTYGQTPKQLFKTTHPIPYPLKGAVKEKVGMKYQKAL